MYFEGRKSRNLSFFLFLLIILLMLISALLIKIIVNYSNQENIKSDYEITKTSSKISENEIEQKNIIELIEKTTKAVVGISKIKNGGTSIFLNGGVNNLGLGSGVVVTDTGYIVTNEHVSGKKYNKCFVTLENGDEYTGNVVWSDSDLDLSIVKIDGFYLDYLNLGDSDTVYLGQEVYAIGNPIGYEFQRTVTKGIISGTNRTIKIEDSENSSYMEDLIQTDATINEGNSGGPIINENGEILAIASLKISNAESMGFGSPINIIKPILEKLIKTNKFEEGYLGIYGYDKEVINYLDQKLNINEGIYIAKIMPDSPLIGKQIEEKEIITQIDDLKINKMNDLKKYIYSKKPGDEVVLNILNNKEERKIKIKLATKIN